MIVKRVGIIGLGKVGTAVIQSLRKYGSLISRRTSLKIEVKGVYDVSKDKKKIASKLALPFTSSTRALINDPDIDIIVELIGGIEPARKFIMEALKKGKNVVTANKALLAKYGDQIFSLAKKKNLYVGVEASVCGAIPLIKSISEGLVACQVNKIYGILNGTTNYILYKMGKDRLSFSSILHQAQKKGIAEKDSSLDIEGLDTVNKLCILSYLCFGIWPNSEKVYTEGISKISLLDILYARQMNYRIKLLAIAKKDKNTLDLRVHPTLVSMEHPLSEVGLAYNAVYFDTQPAGQLLFYGEGAGGVPTSSSVISDIVSIGFGAKHFIRGRENITLSNIKDVKMRYYIRFMAQDNPGVLAKISKILASFSISIASVTQKERKKGKFVPIVMITHEAKEADIRKALLQIDRLSVINCPSQVIRIEDI
ncbi:MAG: homoserine dehydrogenase [Candidatus Omnitrophota bacterium]|nr:MAG: homoserine dehydrogenase [Candidatus Omnitrophota bacterium]